MRSAHNCSRWPHEEKRGAARYGFGRGGRTPQIASRPIGFLARIVADPSSDRMSLGFVRAVVPNSSTKGSKRCASERQTHGCGFAIGPQPAEFSKETANSGANAVPSHYDPDLARIVAAWPTLAEPIKRALLEIRVQRK